MFTSNVGGVSHVLETILFLRFFYEGQLRQLLKHSRATKLKTGYRYENQFWNPGFTDGFRQFCGYQYFCYEILCYLVSHILHFFESLKN